MTSIRTCESTCIGHPDKLCDLIADTVLDDLLFEDLSARCAVEVMATKGRIIVEVMATKGRIIVAGEITSSVKVSIRAAVRRALTRTGGEGAFVLTGAGDQGTVYGYATDETPEYLPLPLVIAHEICKRLDAARMEGTISGISSDGKSQVSLRYEGERAVGVAAVVVSIQHTQPGRNTAEPSIDDVIPVGI